MKLKKFDYKLPHEERDKKKRIMLILASLVICIVITLASSYAYYQSIELQNPYDTKVGEFNSGDIIFAVTIDGESSSIFPTKETGYVATSVTCDKGATGVWNNNLWNIEVGNLTQTKTTCNISFVNEFGKLVYEIKQQGGGSSAIEAKGDPAFNIPTAATSGLYATEDEYGTSYYYRGLRDSLDNNLIFAGFQWKIVRVNGDGSVRIIYNGTEEQFNSNATMNIGGVNTRIEESGFSVFWNDNKYAGYMYGNTSATKDQAQTNTNDSTIKTVVDNWYINNIVTKGISVTGKIADNLFCNDRQLGRDYPGAPTTETGWNGTGAGANSTFYAAYYRHHTNANNPTPTLMCAQKNDRFTVSDVSIGNGSLTYPIGLITADEIAYGGNTQNRYDTNQYLVTHARIWTMTPGAYHGTPFSRTGNFVWVLNSAGILRFGYDSGAYADLTSSYGVRPVLNLDSDTMVTGSGSATDPFKVV